MSFLVAVDATTFHRGANLLPQQSLTYQVLGFWGGLGGVLCARTYPQKVCVTAE